MRAGRQLAEEEVLGWEFLLWPRLHLPRLWQPGEVAALVQLRVLPPESEVAIAIFAFRRAAGLGRVVLRLMPAVDVRHGRVRGVERLREDLELLRVRLAPCVDHHAMPPADRSHIGRRRHRRRGEGLAGRTVLRDHWVDGDAAR
jgi:hypothetical protein